MKGSTPAELQRLATSKNLPALAAAVLELQTADKFRLAALILEQNRMDVAEAIATRAVQEIQLVMLISRKTK